MSAIEGGGRDLIASQVGTPNPFVVAEDDVLREAVFTMLRHKVGHLPVVSAEDHERLVGFVDRSCVMDARLRWYQEEHVREVHRSIAPGRKA